MTDKFKNLTFFKKIQYIYDYYRWHIVIGVITIGILFSIIYHATSKPKLALSIACINAPTTSNEDYLLTQKYAKLNKKISPSNIELVKNFRFSNNKESVDYEYTYASNLKFLARITDKAIDVVIVDKYALHILEKNDYLMPLDSSLNKTVASHKKIAIRLNSDKPLYACIIKNSIHKDEAIKYIHYLVKEEF